MRTDKRYCIGYSIALPANVIIRIKARMPKTINLKKNVNRNLLLTANYDSASERRTARAGLFWPGRVVPVMCGCFSGGGRWGAF